MYTIPTNDIPPYKASHVLLCDGGQGFNLHPFSEVIYVDYKELQLSNCSWERAHDIQPPLS